MPDLVSRAVARIRWADGGDGIGFLAGPDLLLTCAGAWLDHREIVDRGGRLTVPVDFPFLPGPATMATVDQVVDVAGQRVVGLRITPPDGAGPLRLVDVEVPSGRPTTVIGFPSGRSGGSWLAGVVCGRTADGRLEIGDPAEGNPPDANCRGSPVIDQVLGRVVGMVAGTGDRPGRDAVTALSAGALYDAWPELAAPAAAPNPFHGLVPFHPADAKFYSGRDREVSRVRDHLAEHGVVVVTGPAGSGKSSLVLAGLLPRLRGERLAAVVIRPGYLHGPWDALAAGLAGRLGGGDAAAVTAGRLADGGLDAALRQVAAAARVRRLVIVIDQLEESWCWHRKDTAALLVALLEQVDSDQRSPRTELVVTARPEQLHRLARDKRFGDRLAYHTVALEPPDRTELMEIVRWRLRLPRMPILAPGLADTLVDEAAAELTPLPLVEFTLALLYDREERGVLTASAYRELGGVRGAIREYAERVWQEHIHDQPSERALSWLFSQLVSPLPDGQVTRKVVDIGELPPEYAALADRLAATRLVNHHALPDQPATVELVHAVLVRHWPRLQKLVDEVREFRLWQDDLDRSARRWRDDAGRRWFGRRLRRARRVATRYPATLTALQHSFLTASTRWTWWLRTLVVLLVVSLALSTSSVLKTVDARHIAAQRQAQTASLLLLLAPIRQLSIPQELAQVVRAFRTQDNVVTRRELLRAYRDLRHAELVLPSGYSALGVARVNPNATHAIVLGHERSDAAERAPDLVEIYHLATSPPTVTRLHLPSDHLGRRSISWLGSDLLAATDGAEIGVWDLDTGRRILEIHPPGPEVADGGFPFLITEPGGRWLGWTVTEGREVHVIEVASPELPAQVVTLPGPLAPPRAAEPGGIQLRGLTANGEVIIERDDVIFHVSPDSVEPVPSPPFGYEGPTEVVCMPEQGFRLLSTVNGETLAEQPALVGSCDPQHATASAAFSADGRHVAVANGSSLRLGQVGEDLRGLSIPASRVQHVVAEPAGSYRVILSTVGGEVVLRVPPPDPLDRALATAIGAAITDDGDHLLLEVDDRLETWNPSSRQQVATATVDGLADPRGSGTSWRIVPAAEGHLLAVSPPGSAEVRLLSLPDLNPAGTFEPPGLGAQIQLVDADPGGRLLVKRALSYSAWSETGEPLSAELPIPEEFPGGNVLLRPGHAEVVMVAEDTLRRFHLVDGTQIPGSRVALGGGPGTSGRGPTIAMDRGGRYLAIDRGEAVDVWDLESGERVKQLRLADRWPYELPGQETMRIAGLTFDDNPHTLLIDVTLTYGGGQYQDSAQPDRLGTLAWNWRDDSLLNRLTPWLTAPDYPTWAPQPEAHRWALGPYYLDLEPTDAGLWLRHVCEPLSTGPPPIPTSLPDGAYDGPVCADDW